MSLLLINTLLFAQRWREAVTAGQSEHRFHSHSREEREHFEQTIRLRAGSRRPRTRA